MTKPRKYIFQKVLTRYKLKSGFSMTFWIQPGDAVREEDWREVILIELCEIAKGKVSLQLEKILQKNSEICNKIGTSSKLREPLSVQ